MLFYIYCTLFYGSIWKTICMYHSVHLVYKKDELDYDDGDYDGYYDGDMYQKTQRGGQPPTQEELDSSLVNKAPGCPSLSILSFTNAFHGRTMGKHPIHFVYINSHWSCRL